MAPRSSSLVLRTALLALAVVAVGQWALAPAAESFISPRAGPKVSDAASAAAALAALTAALPAQASYNWVGPLTGSEICSTKPIVWLIYPLCDPVFLVSPIYLFPITLIVFGSLVTVLNLLIPATQPDEDLR
mmetsp:Transcript_142874/g.456620  ORF Transcript_142874/g.456620 Transcript_142874/m.456620 type:complete len:132 (+) Transcript_142874:88-483(+)